MAQRGLSLVNFQLVFLRSLWELGCCWQIHVCDKVIIKRELLHVDDRIELGDGFEVYRLNFF